jgi:integrase/recombinase XerD
VTSFLSGLREGDDAHPPLAAGSAARAVVAVRGLHRFAVREGLSAADPARGVRPAAPPRRPPRAITIEDVERLLAAAGPGDTARDLRDRALLEVLYGTGARISEAVGLEVGDVDVAGGVVRLRGARDRVVPLGRYAREALETYLREARPVLDVRGRGDGALFLNTRGGRLSRQSAWSTLRSAAVRADLHDVSPHTLRHSFAAHLLDGGADVRAVQELLGHASVTSTQIYTLVTADRLREAYARPRAKV